MHKESGQVLLITVLALSGTILAATTIAGLLMLYQVRQSTDIVSSTKAIYAADAGLEWRLYKFYKVDGLTCPEGELEDELTNDARYVTRCTEQNGSFTIRSTGISRNAARAFEIVLE